VSLLLPRVAAADTVAARECLDRYGALVWSLAGRYETGEPEAETAVQEVFMELWRQAPRFEPTATTEVMFVSMVTRRKLVERKIGKQRRRDVEAPDVLGGRKDPAGLPEITEEAAVAARTLSAIGLEERQAVLLACGYGLSYEEIGAALAEAPQTVRAKAQAALVRVRDGLAIAVGRPIAPPPPNDRFHDLLIDGVLVGLKLAEAMELQMLLPQAPSQDGPLLEHAAAAVMLAAMRAEHVESPPTHLMTKLDADATRFFFMQRAAKEQRSPEARAARAAERGAKTVLVRDRRRGGGADPLRWAGWIVASLCLGLAAGAWYFRGKVRPPPVPVGLASSVPVSSSTPTSTSPSASSDAGSSLADQRDQLLADAHDLGRGDVHPTKLGPRGLAGDAVWSPLRQRGFLRLRGLSPNDPGKRTYQVWVYDRSQDPHYPVDAGVFNVDGPGEVVIPIAPRLALANATAVTITNEKAGGVVVSKPERLVGIASFTY
jgi:RNA polymerase sigma factor (sigma-70 family)